jgi:lysophospholipase L1-like esterase
VRVVALLAVIVASFVPAASAQGAPPVRPTAIVALGDSASAGQSANDYEPGTDTDANQCHRSSRAFVRVISGFDASFNLACSGATVADVIGRSRHGESPQVEQLAVVARSHDVQVVTLQIGANDEIDFAGIVESCVRAFFRPGGCATDISDRIAASASKVGDAIDAVMATMRDAGYADEDWRLFVLSYASPVTDSVRSRWTKAIEGCPVDRADLAWARNDVTPSIARAFAVVVAQRPRARFVDLSRAFHGREVCARSARPWNEWATGLLVDAGEAVRSGVSDRVFAESFHPNARGHAVIASCLSELFDEEWRSAECTREGDRLRGVVTG